LFPLIAAVELAQPYLLKVAIDDHILKADWLGLTWIAGLYVGVLVLLYALHWLEAYLMNLTGQRVIHDLRAALFAHLLRLEAAFFDRTPVGRLMTRVLGDVEAVSEAFTSGLFAVIADVITLAGVVGVMLWLDWHLALVTFSIFLPIRDLGAKYTVMQSAMASSERIFGLLDRPPAIVSVGRATARGQESRAPAVELQGVWFAYEDEAWVLRDCSLSVAAGERVAL